MNTFYNVPKLHNSSEQTNNSFVDTVLILTFLLFFIWRKRNEIENYHFSNAGSIYTTMAIAIERYITVCHPFFKLSHNWSPKKYIIPILIFSVAYNIPKFAELEVIPLAGICPHELDAASINHLRKFAP